MNSPDADMQSLIQRAGLKAMTIDAVNVGDPVSQGLIKFYRRPGDIYGVVSGVVKYLDLQLVGGIIQVAAGPDQAVDDKLLIKDR